MTLPPLATGLGYAQGIRKVGDLALDARDDVAAGLHAAHAIHLQDPYILAEAGRVVAADATIGRTHGHEAAAPPSGGGLHIAQGACTVGHQAVVVEHSCIHRLSPGCWRAAAGRPYMAFLPWSCTIS